MFDSGYHLGKKFGTAFLLLFLVALLGCSGMANSVALKNGHQGLKIRGKVETVESDIGLLILDGKKDRITISFNDKVARHGFGSLAELKRGNPLEVLYWQDKLGNYAVSIKRLPDGSCDS